MTCQEANLSAHSQNIIMIRRLVVHGCGSSCVHCELQLHDLHGAWKRGLNHTEYWICFMFVVMLWPPDNMLLLQKAVHASTALDGPGGRTCYCSEIYCIDLQLIYRLNVLPSCSGPGDGSLLVPPSLSNVSRPGPSDILLCCTLLYFLCYLLRPMAIKSIQLQLQAPHSMIQYIRYISLLPYWSYCLCGLSC